MSEALVNFAIQEAPTVIEAFKSAFIKANPDQPVPTSEEVIASYQAAFESSIAKDERWLAAHPEKS